MRKSLFFAAFVLSFLSAVNLPAQTPAPASTPDDSSFIRTPKPPESPRINGPRVFGAQPGHPFLYHLPVTGLRPVSITAKGLPDGLTLDATTGNITGSVAREGEHDVAFTATNAKGTGKASIKIIIGKTICLTPPMGWNSWNRFHCRVDDEKVRSAADAMVASGLIEHGWTYVNIDDCWEGDRDAQGNIQPNQKFPDMKALSDYIHGKGLKFGIYSSPGPKTCGGFEASFGHEDQDARTYAGWGVDYVKYDWCSYGAIAQGIRMSEYATLIPDLAPQMTALSKENDVLSSNHKRTPEENAHLKEVRDGLDAIYKKMDPDKRAAIDLEIYKEPYRIFRKSLDKVDRDIVFSFCQYGRGSSWEWAGDLGSNCWRTTDDIGPNWKSMSGIGFGQNGHEKFARPGHWNDPDMLEIGNGDLTPDELYTHMTLWCMLSAPLLIGCDMTRMDDFVVSLFSNDEVLAVNQDSLGKQGWRVKQDGQKEVWVKPLAGDSLAVAFFNRGETAADVSIAWTDLQIQGPQKIRDLWRQKDVGNEASGYTVNVAPHGAELFSITIQYPHWITLDELHAIIQREPPPPAPGSPEDQADLKAELHAQNSRTPERIAESKTDAGYSLGLFSKAAGFKITRETKPLMFLLFQRLNREMGGLFSDSKSQWHRLRPYQSHPEIHPLFEAGGFSYPSGHSSIAFVDALILGQLLPDKAGAFHDRAQQIAQSRVDAGVHYESDIKEGEVIAKELAKELLSKPAFVDEVNAAKTEAKLGP